MQDTAPTTPAAAPHTRPLIAIIALLLGGIGVAVYLTYAKLGMELLDGFESGCNFGETLNCDAVLAHPASSMFGLPISLFAVPMYLLMAFLAWRGIAAAGDARRTSVAYLVAAALLAVAYSVYLVVLTFVEIDAICPFCLGLHATHLVVLVLAMVSHGGGLAGPIKGAFAGLGRGGRPLVGALLVVLVAGGGSVLAYNGVRGSLLADRQARIAQQFAQPVPGAAPATEGQAAPTDDIAAAATVAATAAPTPAPAPKTAPVLPDRPGNITENGYDYYPIPYSAADPSIGPDDAPVTVVSVKDFECGFCRFLSNQIKPLKTKYADNVRFVFKHYPMNADCNYRMGSSRMHERACEASYTAICAHEQDKFWEMHDLLYKKQKQFSDAQLRGYAEELGLDLAAFDACMASDRPKTKVAEDVKLAAKMRLNGTPRVYINNRMVTGSTAKDVLDYYLQMALKHPVPAPKPVVAAPTAETPDMVAMKTAAGDFWIDAFEASISADGKALSVPGVQPALASWFEAKTACEASGKRLCTEEEWVSACIGQAAVQTKGRFTGGPVQGRLYPYGPYYETGACRDSEDTLSGSAGPTGVRPGCRTAEGIYDLSGNLYEWIGAEETRAAQIGGDYRSKTAATCRRRTTTYGPGIRNQTTGFRCCADAKVTAQSAAADAAVTAIADIVGKPVPDDLTLVTTDGGTLSDETFAGKVSYLTFFASWCGNCRKQMPAIKDWQDEWADKGFQVVAINVDRTEKKAQDYIKTLDPNFTIALDPTARTMGDFDINAMPTSFIIGRDGVIKKRVIGYKDAEIRATKQAIQSLFEG